MSGMSRESMKMDGRDSDECQNWKKKRHKCHFWNFLSYKKTKFCIVSSSSNGKSQEKTWRGRKRKADRRLDILVLERERESDFSIKYRAIRLSTVFGTRRKTALRGEGFAWVPDFGSFVILIEVGVSPYLGLFFV